jgi:hypothetical protein
LDSFIFFPEGEINSISGAFAESSVAEVRFFEVLNEDSAGIRNKVQRTKRNAN